MSRLLNLLRGSSRPAIQEDENNLGYFKAPALSTPLWGNSGKHCPAHGGYPGLLSTVEVPDSFATCNAILNTSEQQVIAQAAKEAHAGQVSAAERSRTYANYANLGFRPDADSASGMI